MARLRSLLMVMLAVDVVLWALGFTALWQAAHKTSHLEKVLDEVAPGEAHPQLKMPMLAFTSNVDDTGMVCAVPTKKWLLVPVLGPVMVAKQHRSYSNCLLSRINAFDSLSYCRLGSVRTILYMLMLTVTFAGAKLSGSLQYARVIAPLLRFLG